MPKLIRVGKSLNYISDVGRITSIFDYGINADITTTNATIIQGLQTIYNGLLANLLDFDDNPYTQESLSAFLGGDGTAISRSTVWVSYVDTQYTSLSKFSVLQGITSNMPNNAVTVIDMQLDSVPPLYDPLTTKITPENEGDAYMLRVGFKAENNNVTGFAQLGLDIGGAIGVIFEEPVLFPKGANQLVSFSFNQLIYTLDTFLLNGGQLQLTSITGNTLIWDVVYTITRIHKAF